MADDELRDGLKVTDRRGVGGAPAKKTPKNIETPPMANWLKVPLIILGVAAIVYAWTTFFEEVPFSGEVITFEAADEANLVAVFELTNDGDEPASGECRLEAQDLSGMVGWDVFSSTSPIQPGETVSLNATLRIEDEGAFRVVDVLVEDCGEA